MVTERNANLAALTDTSWVADHLDDADVRLIEVDVDTAAYASGHIPGSVGWNWQTDTQRQPTRDIPDTQEWEQLLSRSGISNDSTVVLYGDTNNWFAAFAYWIFKVYGHDDVRLMNGGRVAWVAEGRDLTDAVADVTPTSYTVENPRPELRALRDDVASAVQGAGTVLIDVRSPAEFSGELLAPENMPQEGAQRGGHIPGAGNVPWGTAVAEDGRFKPVEELRSIYGAKGAIDGTPIITYCRIGERAAHTWFVLSELLGHENVRNYDGSWTEWGSVIGAPIER